MPRRKTTLNPPKIPAAKLIYTLLTMPLIALTELRARVWRMRGLPRWLTLWMQHNGLRCPEAEEYLLATSSTTNWEENN